MIENPVALENPYTLPSGDIASLWYQAIYYEELGYFTLATSLLNYQELGRIIYEKEEALIHSGMHPVTAARHATSWFCGAYWNQTRVLTRLDKNVPKKARKAWKLLQGIPETVIKDIQGITPWDVKKLTIEEAEDINEAMLSILSRDH